MLKKIIFTAMVGVFLTACTNDQNQVNNTQTEQTKSGSYQDIQVAQVEQILAETQGILLDVRTQSEVDAGYIANATHINFYDNNFLEQAQKLDKAKPIIIYCKSGGRSASAAQNLSEAGYKVYNVLGGFDAWQQAGYNVSKK